MNINYALNLFGLHSLDNIDESNLKLTYIKLAKTKHPDKSGSHEEFVALKEAHEMLLGVMRNKKSNLPGFLSNPNSSLSTTNYQVLKEQFEILEGTKGNIGGLIDKMAARKREIELQGIEELKIIEREIDGNVWFNMSKNFLNKYPQSYYDKKTALRIKSQNLKSSVDKQIFKEIIGEYSKTMDMMVYNLSQIDKDRPSNVDNNEMDK